MNALATSTQSIPLSPSVTKQIAALAPQTPAAPDSEPQPGGAQPSAVPGPNAMPVTSPLVVVQFWSEPTGADIEVDGQYMGSTFATFSLPPGQHTVRISKQDFAPWQRNVVLFSGTVRVSAYLERTHATVTFH